MSVLYLLVPLALLLVVVFVVLYVWSTRNGQFDDLHTPALRALLDERPAHSGAPPAPPVAPHRPAPGAPPEGPKAT